MSLSIIAVIRSVTRANHMYTNSNAWCKP